MGERAIRPRPQTCRLCEGPVWARGLCSRHYQADYRRRGPPCSRKGCTRPSFARSLCVRHYQEAYRQRGGPCRQRKCPNHAFSRGLCIMHYHRWYQRMLRGHGIDSIKALPARLRDRPAPRRP